jgi:hypothetical protein
MTVFMEAGLNQAVCDRGPGLPDDDRLAAVQAVGRRPVDQLVGDPVIDAAALVLKDRDDLRLGVSEELDEVRRWIVARPQY